MSADDAFEWETAPPAERTAESWVQWANRTPISRGLGIVCTELWDGRLLARVDEAPIVPNPNGAVHGGLQLAIADHCMGIVAVPVLPDGMLPVSASVHASFHRPAFPPLTIRGRVLSAGRSLVHTEIELYDEAERLCTSGYGTMSIQSQDLVGSRARGD